MIGSLETARFRGLQTSWYRTGNAEKPILLFLHGFPDSPETWEFQVEHFRKDFEVICPYTRGAGPSEPARDRARYGLKASALDLLQLLDEVDPTRKRPVYCVGHDLGAVHAANLAIYLGSRLRALVLMNGLPLPVMARRIDRPQQILKSWYIYAFQVPVLPELALKRFPKSFLRFAHRLGEISEAKALRPEQVTDCLAAPLSQYRAFARELPKAWRDPVPEISCPLLVLWGDRDTFLAPPRVDELHSFASHFTCRILPGNHWVHREKPTRVNRILGDFFAQSRPVSA